MSSESTNAGTAAPERATTVAAAVTAEVPVSASAVDPTPAPGSATVGSDEAKGEEPAVCVANLNVSINKHAILHDVSFKLAPGARCLVLGPNGAGKTTLLEVLAGRHLYSPGEAAQLLGRSCYFDTKLNVKRSFLSSTWGQRTVAFSGFGQYHQADVGASEIMKTFQDRFRERRDLLKDTLDVDLNWRLHAVSDGQRRRVQIMVQLLRPTSVVLMDEVTTGLDVVSRSNFLSFMRKETEERGVACMYATHIFDGLDEWATHLLYLNRGRITRFGRVEDFPELKELIEAGVTSPLYRLVEKWMRADKEARPAESDSRDVVVKADPTSMAAGLGNGFLPGRMVRKMYPID